MNYINTFYQAQTEAGTNHGSTYHAKHVKSAQNNADLVKEPGVYWSTIKEYEHGRGLQPKSRQRITGVILRTKKLS